MERRKEQFGGDFGYFIYPIASEIPGLGTAAGFGATVLNMFDTDADITAFDIDGDFSASGYALLNLHLMENLLLFDLGTFDFDVAGITYRRGMDSSPDEYYSPNVLGEYHVGQVTMSFLERQFELYYRVAAGQMKVKGVLDNDGNDMGVTDTQWKNISVPSSGVTLDLTDDRLDPRKGVRLEVARKTPSTRDKHSSEYYVTDYNLTAYLPMRKWDTLSFNIFRSSAQVTNSGPTDYATMEAQAGLPCELYTGGSAEEANCLATEAAFVGDAVAHNKYGTATPLGGTQRLRSYPGGRFYAGNTLFYGMEYRWNLTDEYSPFDIYVAKGVRTGIQLAVFAEQGSVNDDPARLWNDMRSSYGVGFRAVLSGVIIRFDYATGDEGAQPILFIDYPWSMFSVDNPG